MANDPVQELVRRALARAERQRRFPESTYRLQLHAGFTFRDATAILPYLARLGVTHVYCSPYLKAKAGSTHGYDVIDHCALNPELGTQEEFDSFLKGMRENGLSHVLDTVPNHVGVATNENKWWNDVLKFGPKSKYAGYFDVTWERGPRAELEGKVLLPLLGAPYAEVLEKGELKVERDPDGEWWVHYYDRRFPIAPETYARIAADINGKPGDPRSFDALDDLLSRQHYRLAYWRNASDEINYRRFFDINDLAALSVERQEVFDATQTFTLQLCASGELTGLRIDHPDGLYDPEQYFDRLQTHYLLECAKAEYDADPSLQATPWDELRRQVLERISNLKSEISDPLYVVAEKILAPHEPLPATWRVHGTSGYDFLIKTNNLYVDTRDAGAFTRTYAEFTGDSTTFEDLVYEKKLLILDRALASELHMLAHRLDRLAQRHRSSRDFTLNSIREALRQTIACFPVYRSYVSDRGVTDADRRDVGRAIEGAARRNPELQRDLLEFLRRSLLSEAPEGVADAGDYRKHQLRFAGKFQQLTAPTTAKGVEDTAFYNYHRLISLNEVGGEPSEFGSDPEELHRYLAERAKRWPYAMSALSTHDTKRSEDVRARLNALSEMPDEWRAALGRWSAANERHRRDGAPARDEEYLLYQTLLGAYPAEELTDASRPDVVSRIQAYMVKAMREAKRRTTWTDPNKGHEDAVQEFVAAILDPGRSAAFLADFLPFQRRLAQLGLYNSLSQTLLRLAAPGVPDTYQGTELYDLSLVDPDNRRPVDYRARGELLTGLPSAGAASAIPHSDPRFKLLLVTRALHARRTRPALFTRGQYEPLRASGERATHLFAFARRHEGKTAIAIAPRLVGGLLHVDRPYDGSVLWRQTSLPLPDVAFTDVLTGKRYTKPSLEEVLAVGPLALLVSE